MKKKYQVNLAKFSNRDLLREREIVKEKRILYKNVDTVNSLLKSLKQNNLYDDSGAVENLLAYVNNDLIDIVNTKRGTISKTKIKALDLNLEKNITAISKSLNDFIKNRQSTVKGMKELFDAHSDELLRITDNEEWVKSLSFRQQKNIFKMFKTEEYEKVNSALGSTDIFNPYVTAISEKWTQEKFVDTILRNTGNINDLDLRDGLKDLYNSTIKGKIQYARRKENM